jgi:uncharacterized protein YecT (DUF1311 family)
MNYLYRFFIILFCATFFSLSAQEQAQEMTEEQKAWIDFRHQVNSIKCLQAMLENGKQKLPTG